MRIRSTKNGLLLAGTVLLGTAAGACGGRDAGNTAANRNAANTTANTNTNTAVVNTTPTPDTSQDNALRNTVEANLTKAGVTGVNVSVSGGEVTLRGTIPRARLQDAMKAANDASPKRVNNQLTLQ